MKNPLKKPPKIAGDADVGNDVIGLAAFHLTRPGHCMYCRENHGIVPLCKLARDRRRAELASDKRGITKRTVRIKKA